MMAAAVTIVTMCVSLLGEPGAICLQYAACRPVSSSVGLYAIRLDSTERHVPLPGKIIADSGATVTGTVHMA